jgi:amino acid adenylation domain-containing protein
MNPIASESRSLRSGFLRSAERFGARPAIAIADTSWSYQQLLTEAQRIAATLQKVAPSPDPKLTAVFGHRSFAAFSGILGALLRGHGYVPLNPAFPVERSRSMLERSLTSALIVESASLGLLDELLTDFERPLAVLVPDADDLASHAARWPQHRFVGRAELEPASALQPTEVDPSGIAYLLFTSGSTGKPKGVMVAHRNVTWFIDVMRERYDVTENDRFSQTFDLTFDLSVFDMFLAWEVGACVQCPTQKEKLFPSKYVLNHGLTVWFSVPSTAVMMKRLRMLKPGHYPGLRWSLFCGEALPVEVTQAWAEAAPSSTVENLYGPTELTIACTLYRFRGAASVAECEQGVVPIGEPYPGMKVLIADESLNPAPAGQSGELLMTGPQLSLGYWQDPERTAQAFVRPPGKEEVYYRTGDRVRQLSEGGPLVYLGRVDNQIKILGYRVELGEIEAVLREEAGVDVAIAVGFPVNVSGADGVVGFIQTSGADTDAIRERVKERLPPYMHPSEIRQLDQFPLNANGKVDRKALLALLQNTVT